MTKTSYESRLIIGLTIAVFLIQFVIFGALNVVSGQQIKIYTAIIDATILVMVLYPILFRFVYRPLILRNSIREDAEEKFRVLVESSPNALLSVAGESGTILFVNRRVEEVFGYRAEELIGKGVEILIPERIHSTHQKDRRKYMTAPTERGMGVGRDLYGRHKDGHEVPLEIALTPVKMKVGTTIVTTITDITMRKALERQKNDALKAREELVAVVSHEVKNPLSTITMGLQIIRRKLPQTYEGKAEADKQLEQIAAASERMTKITSDLLDVTRIEAGRLRIEPTESDVGEIVNTTVSAFQPLAEKKSISIESHVSLDAKTITCDKDRIIQVLSNLLGNAIKFTGDGGSVTVEAQPQGEIILFRVKDTGPGIPPDEALHVFERFWQAKHRQFIGAGLGLYISKSIVECHGGKIGMQSKVGQGSEFFFSLPLRSIQTK